MNRQRVNGRFVPTDPVEATDQTAPPKRIRTRRSRLLGRARRTLQEAVPKVADKLVEEANKGSVPHIKLLLQLLGLEDGGLDIKQAGAESRTLEQVLMDQWHRQP
jgi:hypothetical protein